MNKKKVRHIYANKGIWYILYKDPGTKKWKGVSTKLPATRENMVKAIEYRNKLQEEINKCTDLIYRDGNIKYAFKHFCEINSGKSKATKKTYEIFYGYLIKRFKEDALCQVINKKSAEDFLLWLNKLDNIAQNTKYGIQKNFLKFLRFLFEYEYIPQIFIINKDVKIRPKVFEPLIFTDADRQKILTSLDDKEKNGNFKLLIMLLMYTGLRPSDIINIPSSEVNIEKMEMKFYSSKTDQWFIRPLHPALKNILKERIDEVKSGRYRCKEYDSASVEEKKYMIKTIIREIKVKLKKNEDKGEIDIHFRGDGLIKKEWVNKTVNPDKLVSSYYLDWLREQDSNLQPSG